MLATTIAECELNNCIYNASGVNCTTEQQLSQLGQAEGGAILSKSSTFSPRKGNPEPRYYHNTQVCHDHPYQFETINSTGLANNGYDYYSELAPILKARFNKPYFMSVSGLSKEDNLEILEDIQESQVDAIELNLSCPNVPGKSQVGYDFEATEDLIRNIYETIDMTIPLGLKLPPYFDRIHIQKMSDVIQQYPISFITCINSLGNGLIIEPVTERPVIKPNNGLGGIGGSVTKSIALSNVFQFHQQLGGEGGIDIIGCGGVRNGWDAFEHILVGAKAVQVGSTLYEEGPNCLGRISAELMEIMSNKGYNSIEDFRGKLKPFSAN